VQPLSELQPDAGWRPPAGAPGGGDIDLSLLTACLCPSDQVRARAAAWGAPQPRRRHKPCARRVELPTALHADVPLAPTPPYAPSQTHEDPNEVWEPDALLVSLKAEMGCGSAGGSDAQAAADRGELRQI
jgi:hypothetical protein